MNPKLVGMRSLIAAYDALGLPERPPVAPPDVSLEAIMGKITNPGIAAALGATEGVTNAIHLAELIANLLDAYSETGTRQYLIAADAEYTKLLQGLPRDVQTLVQLRGAAALSYFQYEQDVAGRISRGELFLSQETIEYLLRRGSDAPIYAAILSADGIRGPGLTAGFRLRQALWDLRDDVLDVEQDRLTVGANVLLMSTRGSRRQLRGLADSLHAQAAGLKLPKPLLIAVDQQYGETVAALS